MFYCTQAGNTAYDLASVVGHTDVCQELLTHHFSWTWYSSVIIIQLLLFLLTLCTAYSSLVIERFTFYCNYVCVLIHNCFAVCLRKLKLLCIILVWMWIYKEYPEIYKQQLEVEKERNALLCSYICSSPMSWLHSYMHALTLASLKTWNPKESAGSDMVSLASCSTGSSSGREVLSTSGSRWPLRVTCLDERGVGGGGGN